MSYSFAPRGGRREIKQAMKRLAKSSARLLGLESRHTSSQDRSSLRGILLQVRDTGFRPTTIIDVGVADGTPELYDTFPEARLILVEPLVEYEAALKRIQSSYNVVQVIRAAAASTEGTTIINVHPDLSGSSMFLEGEASDVNGVPREIPQVRLDGTISDIASLGDCLLKIDVQGAELEVIAGLGELLERCECVVLETSLFPVFEGGAQLIDSINRMKEAGFVVYDIASTGYRPLDGALWQVDMCFVKEHGPFRQHHYYATAEQRARQTAGLLRGHERG